MQLLMKPFGSVRIILRIICNMERNLSNVVPKALMNSFSKIDIFQENLKNQEKLKTFFLRLIKAVFDTRFSFLGISGDNSSFASYIKDKLSSRSLKPIPLSHFSHFHSRHKDKWSHMFTDRQWYLRAELNNMAKWPSEGTVAFFFTQCRMFFP